MSNLSSFLKINVTPAESEKEVYISKRFKEPFVIKLLSPGELSRMQSRATSLVGKKAAFDTDLYNREAIKYSVVVPDLKDAELQDSYGVVSEEDLINEMLTGAEYIKLVTEITEFNSLDESMDDKIKEAKN